tara:strand:+ start:615 stop:794 length:180 start_codon:yes stop_codon:yes gene_type:complete
MKYWITEYINGSPGVVIGPYIKANSMLEASRIAIEHGLFVIGEIHELEQPDTAENRVIH